jgi:arabinan endo-1,5-alpha-L-arabinosidase
MHLHSGWDLEDLMSQFALPPKCTPGYFGLAILLGLAAFIQPAGAQTSGANGTHDPSRMIESEGKVYVYSTGGGSKSSADGLVWTSGPRMQPDGMPSWTSSFSGAGIWAPDGLFFNGKYFLFYSGCAGNGNCFTGVQTSPTLNPSAANYKWTDQGMIASNSTSDNFAPIDPAPIVDPTGNLWVIFGGGYANPSDANAIFVARLDNNTGLPLASNPKPGTPVLKGHKEGTYLHYRNGFYYIFWQTGGCCSGTSSTYQINMARSASITGPFTGDRVFYATQSALNIHGPGHIGIYQCGDVERFTYHYYPSGGSVLGENALSWGSDGWPVAGAVSATPLKLPCGSTGSGIKAAANGEQYLLVRKSAAGYRIFVPESRGGVNAEILDVHGKVLNMFKIHSGWNDVSVDRLQSGINLIRIASAHGNATSLIVNTR